MRNIASAAVQIMGAGKDVSPVRDRSAVKRFGQEEMERKKKLGRAQ